MDIAELITRSIVLVIVLYLLVSFVRVMRAGWRWLRARSLTGAAHVAGRVAGKVERTAADAAAAFKDGRGR